jgi:hypothetical protein
MRKLGVILCVVAIAGCSHDAPRVDERAATWEKRVAAELPHGAPRSDVEAWAGKNSIVLASDLERKQRATLEVLRGDGLVCSKWHIDLVVTYDSSDRLSVAEVKKLGVCL